MKIEKVNVLVSNKLNDWKDSFLIDINKVSTDNVARAEVLKRYGTLDNIQIHVKYI